MVDFARLYVVIRIFIPDTSDKDCLALCSEKKQMNKREINPKETRGHKRSNKRHLKHTEGERRLSRILLYIWSTQWRETPIRSGNKGNLKLNSFRKLLAVFIYLSFTSWHFSEKPRWHRLISFFLLVFFCEIDWSVTTVPAKILATLVSVRSGVLPTKIIPLAAREKYCPFSR